MNENETRLEPHHALALLNAVRPPDGSDDDLPLAIALLKEMVPSLDPNPLRKEEALPDDGQLCDKCGGPDEEVWFCHDSNLWEMVTGNQKPPGTENAKGLMCIRCFDEATRHLGIWVEWAPLNIQHLTFSAHPMTRTEVDHA